MTTNLNANGTTAHLEDPVSSAALEGWGPERRYWHQKADYFDAEFWFYSIKREFQVHEMSMFFCAFQAAKEHLTESQWKVLADKIGVTPEVLSEIATVSDHVDYRNAPMGARLTKLARAFSEVFAERV
jgi:hypothetical protein